MAEIKQTREQLERRRDEINDQLNHVNDESDNQLNHVNQNLQMEFERDPEEQSIEVAESEVTISMETNLREELAIIEDKLIEFEVE